MRFIAHKGEEDGEEQLLIEHLINTAKMAEAFAKVFGGEEWAYIAGILHDLGKYALEFQDRILNNGKKCDHSSAGARLLKENNNMFWSFLGYLITGHHSGLLNFGSRSDVGEEGTFYARFKKDIPDYSHYKDEIDEKQFEVNQMPQLKIDEDSVGFVMSFYLRMLYSCLVDADFLDTERFMNNNKVDRKVNYDFNDLLSKLKEKTDSFTQDTLINQYRKQILDECIEAAKQKPWIYRLTVPTGGGKTLASAMFALTHIKHNPELRRIIYVVPYCSIIEQNAKEFSKVFGKDIVLEHHSNYDFGKDNDDEINNKKKLATENWDMPFIVTTSIQFFESLFASKSSKCRKLHNIANSIIIFDEIQALPTTYIEPCLRAVSELVVNYGSTAVLCSATQPELDKYFESAMPRGEKPKEICKDVGKLFEIFRRVQLKKLNRISMDDLANRLEARKQALVVLNTKRQVKDLYEKLKGDGVYHLSAHMCPKHREQVIDMIKVRLKAGLPCKVISTNLIEAGVDLDFPVVYRELVGLDSIIQAAGRANREGKLEFGEVFVFSFIEDEYKIRTDNAFRQYLKICSDNAEDIMNKYEDVFSPEAIKEYFTKLYNDLGDNKLDVKGIMGMHKDALTRNGEFRFDFKKVAEEFKLIEEDTCPVVIAFDDTVKDKIKELKYKKPNKDDIRSLQPYMVNVRYYEYRELIKSGRVVEMNNLGIMENDAEYDDEMGLVVSVKLGSADHY